MDAGLLEQEIKPQEQSMLVKGIGLFTDAYYLFVMNLVNVILAKQFCTSSDPEAIPFNCSETEYDNHYKSALSMSIFLGAVLGQTVFGRVADIIGRKITMIISCALLILGGILCATAYAKSSATLFVMLSIWRFILGIGIGAEYPLSASSCAESANDANRGRAVSSIFSLQGIGNLVASIAGNIVIQLYALDEPYQRENLEKSWRILFALGTLPSLIGFYFRLEQEESHAFREREKGMDDLTSWDKTCFIVKYYGWTLVGTSGSWFFFDILFYSQGIFSATVLSEIHTQDNLQVTSMKNVFLALAALPGYYFAVFFIDTLGRKSMQIMGFSVLGFIFLLMVFTWETLQENPTIFLIFYGATFFFCNFGPNTTTFLIPTESFPTAIRSTCHGISAAFGKLGAALGVFIFIPISTNYGNKYVFLTCGIIAIFCVPFTMIFTQPDRLNLRSLENEFLDYMREYRGEATHLPMDNKKTAGEHGRVY